MIYEKTSTLLKIDHVSLSYGSKVVLRDVNAEIKDIVRPDCTQGQVICFLGPSGMGKTQLSKIIAGLKAPTSGTVYVKSGPQGSEWKPAFPDGTTVMAPVGKGMVGMVPQNYPLFKMSVQDNLTVAGRMAGLTVRQIEALGLELMNAFDLYQYRTFYPKELSGGTRQRVAIIRQLMCQGHYLVMDEPFSGLDPIMKAKATALIQQVANRDELNTIIVVTHDITEGLSVADTVWLLGEEPGLPGARLVEQIDMAAEDLCWHPELVHEARFQAFVSDVKKRFPGLVQRVAA